MGNYHLRPAVAADSVQIRKLIRAVGINPMSLDWNRFILAVDEENRVIGCGQLKPHQDGSVELASIAIIPERRGEGIAREIIEYLITTAPSGPLYLTCRSGLGELYERFGFIPIGEDQMPPYFRKISRIFRLFTKLRVVHDTLLVMKKEI